MFLGLSLKTVGTVDTFVQFVADDIDLILKRIIQCKRYAKDIQNRIDAQVKAVAADADARKTLEQMFGMFWPSANQQINEIFSEIYKKFPDRNNRGKTTEKGQIRSPGHEIQQKNKATDPGCGLLESTQEL